MTAARKLFDEKAAQPRKRAVGAHKLDLHDPAVLEQIRRDMALLSESDDEKEVMALIEECNEEIWAEIEWAEIAHEKG